MKKVYISMSIKGKRPDKIEIDKQFLLRLCSVSIHEPVEIIERKIDIDNENIYMDLFGENIKNMSEADYVIFADGYYKDKICNMEFYIASNFYKTILFEHGNKLKGVS